MNYSRRQTKRGSTHDSVSPKMELEQESPSMLAWTLFFFGELAKRALLGGFLMELPIPEGLLRPEYIKYICAQ